MGDEQQGIILCVKVSDMAKAYGEARVAYCSYCHAEVWLSKPTVNQVKADPRLPGGMDGIKLMCRDCYLPLSREGHEVAPPSMETIECVLAAQRSTGYQPGPEPPPHLKAAIEESLSKLWNKGG